MIDRLHPCSPYPLESSCQSSPDYPVPSRPPTSLRVSISTPRDQCHLPAPVLPRSNEMGMPDQAPIQPERRATSDGQACHATMSTKSKYLPQTREGDGKGLSGVVHDYIITPCPSHFLSVNFPPVDLSDCLLARCGPLEQRVSRVKIKDNADTSIPSAR
jgi:hypothetical protein